LLSKKRNRPVGKHVRINPAIYALMKVVAKADRRSTAKAIDWACAEYLRLNHPEIAPSSGSVELPKDAT
jgi:hypothetical protein